MRLIDADTLIERIGEWMPHDKCGEEDIKDIIYAEACVDLIDVIKDAPTVEQIRWTPCSERLPGLGEEVIVSICEHEHYPERESLYTDNPVIDRFVMVATFCRDDLSTYCWIDESTGNFEIPKKFEVVAWMDFPNPYKGENE